MSRAEIGSRGARSMAIQALRESPRSRPSFLAALLCLLSASCRSVPQGPGVRFLPAELRGSAWSSACSGLHPTIAIVDSLGGKFRVDVVTPASLAIRTFPVERRPWSVTSTRGGTEIYLLMEAPEGREPAYVIRRIREGAPPVDLLRSEGVLAVDSTITLSPDESTIAFMHSESGEGREAPWQLSFVDVASGATWRASGTFRGDRPCWLPEGRSLIVTEALPDVDGSRSARAGAVDSARWSLVERETRDDSVRRSIAKGCRAVLSADGTELIYGSIPSGRVLSIDVQGHRSPVDAAVPVGTELSSIVALGTGGVLVVHSGPDPRMPEERGGHGFMGPAVRGSLSVHASAQKLAQPLLVGLAPLAMEFRW